MQYQKFEFKGKNYLQENNLLFPKFQTELFQLPFEVQHQQTDETDRCDGGNGD